jgi:hypothetical protein
VLQKSRVKKSSLLTDPCGDSLEMILNHAEYLAMQSRAWGRSFFNVPTRMTNDRTNQKMHSFIAELMSSD